METERQARREKIKSREMDRMALITGRISNLGPSISKSTSFSDIRTNDLPKHSRSSSEPSPPYLILDRAHGEDDDDVPNTYNDEDFSKQNTAASFRNRRNRSSSVLVATPKAKLPRKPVEYHLISITRKDINHSIISSEKTRLFCSLVIALLVLLSHIDPIFIVVKSESLIASRPLYAVLLSDLLIAAATLALLSFRRAAEQKVEFEKDVNWDGAVKVLEWGIILHQTVRAIFIDCSLYLAIVICGLSLMH
ncbi:hypothetical protein SASPL_110163 [Salvia splendens]|uniref:Uncharacterized protein n=1 Tax=Salvia splendens TaxID=180675 RepID=A0A8X9A259_SALSN|nr:uncharacterized protein LOC121800282 [Salvia splendens]KAG6425952.1 hypothetical protein SASPL_110163 [Salvia splendens]